jgi:hypothetical protein
MINNFNSISLIMVNFTLALLVKKNELTYSSNSTDIFCLICMKTMADYYGH